MIPTIRGVAGIFCLGFISIACGQTGVLDSPRRFEVTLTVDSLTRRVNQEFTFRLDAKGPGLSDVTFDYGDGQTFFFLAQGATTVGLAQKHAYTAARSYRIEGTARLASGEILADQVDVIVRE